MAHKKVTLEKSIATVDTETGEVLKTEDLPSSPTTPRTQLADEMLDNEYKPFFKTPNNHDTLAEARKFGLQSEEPTLTQQHLRDEVDINHILAKFGVAALSQPPSRFLDIPPDLDMGTALNNLRTAREAFEALPANLQQHFESIENYVDYVDQAIARNDVNALADLNLVDRPEPPKPQQEPPQAPPPTTTATPPSTTAPQAPST